MTKEIEAQLIEAAQVGAENAYTKNKRADDYRIGAAVLTKAGNIYSSGQYYSDTASLTIHAEQAVLAHAAAHGEYDIEAIVVTWNEVAGSDSDDSIYPCHMCKQLLWESHLRSGCNTEILIIEKGSIIERLLLKDIMSYTWP